MIRLHCPAALAAGCTVVPTADQQHRLLHVMRIRDGDAVALFNGRDGEWLARANRPDRRTLHLVAGRQIRPATPEPGPWLAFAPVRTHRTDVLVTGATELGVARLLPVLTARTRAASLKTARLQASMTGAAEQCERLTVPQLDAPVGLARLLADWPGGRRLLAAVERGTGPDLAAVLAGPDRSGPEAPPGPWGLLIGPEGGFTASELDLLARTPNLHSVRLGSLILRSETAALAGLAVIQALAGAWPVRHGRPAPPADHRTPGG